MPNENDLNTNSVREYNSRLSDPMADQKTKARQRLVGSIFFSFFVFIICISILREKPRKFVSDLVIQNKIEGNYDATPVVNQNFSSEIRLSSRDKRIIEISNLKVWMVRVGIFVDKKKAQDLKKRLLLEGKSTIIVPNKIGNLLIYFVKVGPLNQDDAEKFRRQALSRGLNADIDRL